MPPDNQWPKTCRCGMSWSSDGWKRLTLVGFADGGEEGELELRNCTCGSTLAVRRAPPEGSVTERAPGSGPSAL
jgi:hypothetical protein